MIPTAVALEMTECDVVKRAGFPERVDIGSTERNERQVTLTYTGGTRPGVYMFVAGRLKSMSGMTQVMPRAGPNRANRGKVHKSTSPGSIP